MLKLREIYEKAGLKYTIFIIYGVLLVCMIISTSFISGLYVRKSVEKDIYDNLIKTNYQSNKNIDYTLAIYETVLNNLCINDYLQSILSRNTQDVFQSYLDLTEIRKILSVQNLYPDINKIEIIPEKGLRLIDRDVVISKDDDIYWYNSVIEDDYYNINWVYTNDGNFEGGQIKEVIRMYKQIKDFRRGQLLGVIRITLSTKPFNKLLTPYADRDNITLLFDNIGSVIFLDDRIQKVNDNGDVYKNIFQDINKSDMVTKAVGESTINMNGKKFTAFYCSDNRAGFILVNIISKEYPVQKLIGLEFIIIVIGMTVLVAGLLANYLLSNYITKDIHVLVNKIKTVSEGNTNVSFSDVLINRKDEIGYLYRQFEIMLEKINSLYKDIYESKIKQKEIELKALQAQINPHFLYNTLSSINWMAIDINAKDISHAINTLARYYRHILSKGKEIIQISDEIDQIKSYVDIQKIRFKNKFDVMYKIDEGVFKYATPKLILQPFVENSIIHGLEHIDYMGLITILCVEDKDEIKFKVIDNGRGIERDTLLQLTSTDLSRSGYGIKNVVEKINLIFGDSYGIHIESEETKGTCVIINIPKLYIEDGEVIIC